MMSINWDKKFSERAGGLYGSMTRKLMHVMADPEVISFGGGLPAWDLFPIEQIRTITDDLLKHDGAAVLQYSTSEGYRPLREKLAERFQQRDYEVTTENILIDTGSMQGIDLMGKLFLDQGDTVVLGDPTFLTALQAFGYYQANYLTLPVDDAGMQVAHLPQILENNEVKFIYIMPTFQNPTGRTLSLERRHQLVKVATHYGVPIVEDDAYGDLRYEGDSLPSLKSLDKAEGVIYLGSFSKILSPGLRVGFIIAPNRLLEKLLYAKQASDLHTSVLPQRIAHEFLRQGYLDPHIQFIIHNYCQRRDAMLAAMASSFPSEVSYTHPEGGIFLWVTLPDGQDAGQLFDRAVAEKVVYVPGANYFANGSGHNTMRLNFSANSEREIAEGIRRLAKIL
ncbi:MAG: PLP-dependent aminotransferase family protein [Chloroflexi bacterium]|nr:PLP-dependent aminotransferase family protein [Chloroflexota bacterium]